MSASAIKFLSPKKECECHFVLEACTSQFNDRHKAIMQAIKNLKCDFSVKHYFANIKFLRDNIESAKNNVLAATKKLREILDQT